MSGRVVNGNGPHLLIIDGRRAKCADLDTADMLRLIDHISRTPWYSGDPVDDPPRWVSWFEVTEHYPDHPTKLVWAKCCNLIHRGLVSGCDCGCRGDMEITPKGRAMIDPAPVSVTSVANADTVCC